MPRRREYPPRQPPKTSRTELTRDQRNHIVGAAAAGEKTLTIARRLGIPKSTVYDTIQQGPGRDDRGQVSRRRGRSRKTT
ncbi:MAG: hypothetical protein M1823_006321, partial [Watsoniomyces obsoletus]